MKKLIIGICLLGCLTSCGGKNTDAHEEQMEWADSIEAMADSLLVEEVEEEPVIPAAADESFADFCTILHWTRDYSCVVSYSHYPIIWIIRKIPL